jgi:hypothetical protein
MLTAVLNVCPKISIHIAQFLILSRKPSNLFIALVHLIYSQPKRILSLVEYFREIIISHCFSLGCLVVVYGLALEFFGEATNFSNVLLKGIQVRLGIGSLCLERSDVLHEAVNVFIESIVLILIGHDFVLQNGFLVLQLNPIFL